MNLPSPVKRWAIFVALILPALSTIVPLLAAIPGTTSYHYARTPSNKIDTRYHDGDDGTAATPLTWATITPITVLSSATGSVNVCSSYLEQPAAPDDDAVISVSTGFALPTGFSLGSTNNCVLSWATPAVTNTSVSLTATLTGVIPAVSLAFSIVVTTTPVGDTTAPTVPTGCSITNNTGSFTVACDASSDPFDGTAGSGVTTYEVCLNGAGCQTTPAIASVAPQLTSTNVGSLTPVPASSQSGADWALTSAGTSDGTTDSHIFVGAAISGDFTATLKVNGITTSTDFAKCGIQLRDSTSVAGSKKFECHAAKNANASVYSAASQRLTDGAVRSTLGSNLGQSLPQWLRVKKTGTTETCEFGLSANSFTTEGTASTIGFGSAPVLGIFATSSAGTGGAEAECDAEQLNITAAPRWSYTYTTASSGTVTVRANDVSGNHSAYNSVGTATPSTPSDSTAPTRTVQPTNPGASGVSSTTITWDLGTCTDSSGIRGYIPYSKTSSGGTRTTQAEQSVNSWTQTGLSASTTYYLDVKCVDNAGNLEASFSSQVSATTAAAGADPTSAPTISAFAQKSDRSASYTLVHSTVANAHHYNVQVADCANGITPGSYTTVSAFQHTTGTVNLTGFSISDAKSVRVQSANSGNTVVFNSTATACEWIFEPWTQAPITSNFGHYAEIYATVDRTTVERPLATSYFALAAPWKGVMRSQLQLGSFEGPLSGNATTHSTANPATGAGYERGKELMDWYLGQAAAQGKSVIMMLSDKVHGNYPTPISPTLFPAYFKTDDAYNNPADPADNGGYFISETGTQGTSGWAIYGRVWVPLVAESYADAAEWMCRTYDSNPAFEGIQLTSVSVPANLMETSGTTAHSGYNWAGYVAGVKTILARARQYCVHKNVSIRFDWPGSGITDGLAFYRWARGYRITASEFDTVDYVTRTGSVTPGTAGSEGEHPGLAGFRGAATSGATTSGTAGVNLIGKAAVIGGVQSLDWVRSKYGINSINEYFEIGSQYKYNYIFWLLDTFSCGQDSNFTPTNLGPTTATGTNCPGSGTTISTVIRNCLAATTDQPTIGCTIAIRNSGITATCPTDWIGCSLLPILGWVRRRRREYRRPRRRAA
jgi:hypothetical protein